MKLESLNINGSVDEIIEYVDQFNSWMDTRGTSNEKPITDAFLTTVGKEQFTLLRTLVYFGQLRCQFSIFANLLGVLTQESFRKEREQLNLLVVNTVSH